MVTYLSTTITNILIRKDIIKQTDREIYQYGVLTMIVNLFSIVELLFLGWITDTFVVSVVYLIAFFLLRSFTGGFHFQNYIPCNISYGCIYLICAYVYLHIANTNIFLNIITAISLVVIYIMSPVVHVNKPLKELKKKRNGLIAKVIATNLFILSFFGLTLGIIKYVIIGTALLQLITKGGKDYVE